MIELRSGDVRTLLQAPLQEIHAVRKLGRALWLYLWLVVNANTSGHVCRSVSAVGRDLGVPVATVTTWLERLQNVKLVRVQSPVPYLVIKLRLWPSKGPKPRDSGLVQTRARGRSSMQQILEKQASGREDGGAGEGEMLLRDALRVLGPTDEAQVRELVTKHPAEVVRRALRRVERTPPERIRKSRLALFRYLILTLPRKPHATT